MDQKIKQQLTKFFKEQGSKGGKATVKKYGKKHMSNLVKRRWAKVAKIKESAP